MDGFEKFTGTLSSALWGAPLMALLLFTHLFLTVRLKGIQRHVFYAVKLSVTREKGASGDVRPFSALMTALASTIGTGNIVGVASAVACGGPGAVFWMWLSGILGMSTKYAESLLGVRYRIKKAAGMSGGPMYVLERALKMKWLACIFAFATMLAALGIGAMVQSNSAAGMFKTSFGIPPAATGLVAAVLCACVILGGIKSISKVCTVIIPAAGLLFIAGNLAVLATGAGEIPATLAVILKSAFTGQAAAGGFCGAAAREAARFGVSRGLFSNEAGLGSEPIVAASAQTANPVRQALVSFTGTFWDTVVMAALTGIVIVNTGDWKSGLSGGELTARVFSRLPFGSAVLAACLFAFALATMIGWSFYAEKAAEYLFGRRAVNPYKAVYTVFIFLGAVFSLNTVWNLSDIANAFMAVPNLFTLIALNGEVVRETRRFFQKKT